MTTERAKVACPHCGAPNSSGRRICFECQQELVVKPEPSQTTGGQTGMPTPQGGRTRVSALPTVRARPLTPRPTPVSPPRELTAEQVRAKHAAAIEAQPTPGRKARMGVILGATLGQRAQMYHQMYGLLRAGIPLSLSLSYLSENIPPHLRGLAIEMLESVQHGGLFSTAMERYPSIFPEWEICVVKAHEKAGTLPQAMNEIAEQLDLEADLRRRANAATLSLKATALVFILVVLVVAGVQGSGGGLGPTLEAVGHSFTEFAFVVALIVAVWQGWKALSITRGGARFVQFILQRTPLIGPIIRNIQRLRFARVLGALWDAGVSPIEALETAATATGNPYYKFLAGDQMAHLKEGGSMADAIEGLRVLKPEALHLIRSGEVAGSIGGSLKNVAEYTELELDSQVKTLPAKLQLWFYAIIVPLVLLYAIHFYTGYFSSMMGGE